MCFNKPSNPVIDYKVIITQGYVIQFDENEVAVNFLRGCSEANKWNFYNLDTKTSSVFKMHPWWNLKFYFGSYVFLILLALKICICFDLNLQVKNSLRAHRRYKQRGFKIAERISPCWVDSLALVTPKLWQGTFYTRCAFPSWIDSFSQELLLCFSRKYFFVPN